jgi:hypothetical protein
MRPKSSRTGKIRNKARKKAASTCFVLMPFGAPFDEYYRKIFRPAIRKAGLNAVRADTLFRPAPIMEDIWRFVRQAKVLLAELTGKNPNVFYELGLAHAIGKPVVLVSNKLDHVPFDLRGLRTIIYDKNKLNWPGQLRESIFKSLKETQADMKKSVPRMFWSRSKPRRP